MTKRIFKFYDKNNKEDGVFYDNVTEEEFDTLQYYYRKEKYMMGHQHIHTGSRIRGKLHFCREIWG